MNIDIPEIQNKGKHIEPNGDTIRKPHRTYFVLLAKPCILSGSEHNSRVQYQCWQPDQGGDQGQIPAVTTGNWLFSQRRSMAY
jgi:hypothetical protein